MLYYPHSVFQICMSANKKILIADITTWNFSDTNVDVVGVCQEKFLVVGERSGNIHLIHIPSKKTLLTKVQ